MKTKRSRQVKSLVKKIMAWLLTACIIWQNAAPRISFGNETKSASVYTVTEDELINAVKASLNKKKSIQKENVQIDGDYACEYEDLVGFYDESELYKLTSGASLDSASPSNLRKMKIVSYLKMYENDELSDEETFEAPFLDNKVIFVVKNFAKSENKVTLNILGNEFTLLVPSKDFILNGEYDFENEDNIASDSDVVASKETVASDSDLARGNENIDDEETNDFDIDIAFYEPVVIDGAAAVAFSISANDILLKAKETSYSYDTESATVVAYASPECFSEPVSLKVREFDSDEDNSMTSMLRSRGNLVTGTKSFDIHFLNEDGDEVEPDGAVDVTIRLKSGVLSKEIDPSSFTVCHIAKDVEDHAVMPINEIVYADDVSIDINEADENESQLETLPATVRENNGSYDIHFTTESFSYFVMSYNGFNNVWAYLYDEDGNQLPGTNTDTDEIWANPDNKTKYNPQDFCANWNGGSGSANSNGKWISFETLASLLYGSTSGYVYLEAYTDSDMKDPFNWIYFESVSGYTGNWWVSTLVDKPTAAPSESDGTSRKITEDTDGYMKLFVKYRNDNITSPIDDQVETNGYFFVSAPENISEYATVNYKWYRSDDGENFEEVIRKKAANKTYNIEVDATGSKLYPSRDTSIDVEIRRWYKAEVYVDGKLYKEYTKRQVQNYPCIMNGSFETPDVTTIGEWMYDFPNGTKNLYWKTTGEDKQIEVIRASNWAGNAYNCSTASGDGGVQWAELNAEKSGALYQHVLVQPESTLYWHFAHRGRNGVDTMYMVIAPKNKISTSSSTAELIEIAKKIKNGYEGYTEEDGFQTLKVQDSNTAWTLYEGEYTVPDSVWLLDFFFISASGTTLGNMIDDVSFSTTVPGPVEGCANITAVENVSGLFSDDMENLTMKVWLEDEDGNVASDKNGLTAERTVSFGTAVEENGVYKKTVTFPNIPDDKKYTLKKILYFNGSEVIPDGYTHVTEAFAMERNGVLEDKGTGCESTFMAYDEHKDKIRVDFVDEFEIDQIPITITKKLVGNAVEAERKFTFKLSGTLENGVEIIDEISADDQSFTLCGGESRTVNVPFGSLITITEEDLSDEHYVTYHEIVPGETIKGNTVTIPGVTQDKEVLFANKRAESHVTFKKVGEDGKRLSGAVLTLYKGKTLSENTMVGSFTTDGANDWTLTLMNGDYTLIESSAPDGYRIADAMHIHIDESGVVTCDTENAVEKTGSLSYTVTMINKKLIGSVVLENEINESYDPFGTPSFIYEISKKDGSYKKVVILTMDSLKKNEALDLPAGEYTVKQISVERYVSDVNSMDFTVVDGETTKISFRNTIQQYEKFSHVTAKVNHVPAS